MSLLIARSLSKSYDGRIVVRGVDLAVDPGHRAGLVGENGIGKSTVLRLLAGVEEPDDGDVTRPADLGYLHQEFPYTRTTTVGSVIESALVSVREIEQDLEQAAIALTEPDAAATAAYEHALARAEQSDVWSADARAARTLAGLGLEGMDRRRPVGELSGGQRTRLGLAALLIRQPGALLLDEPTNHLDDAAAQYLATALRTLPGAVLLASHDRVFLDDVCTEIIDLDPTQESTSAGTTGNTVYGGGYTDYLEAKRVERERWEQRFTVEQEELAALRKSVATTARELGYGRRRDNDTMAFGFKRNEVQQQVSRRVRNARLRLDTLDAAQVRKPPASLRFTATSVRGTQGTQPGHTTSGGIVAWARGVVVRGIEFPAVEVTGGQRLLVTGDNGAGKSTLLGVLAGDLVPTIGDAGTARSIRVGLLEQDPNLGDESRTPRTVLVLAGGADLLEAPTAHVDAHGLVAPRDLDRPIGLLSVGQRRRVLLAMLMIQAPDVLLLDEPTNHISLRLADELLDMVPSWPGAVVIASHDRWLRRRWSGDVLHLG